MDINIAPPLRQKYKPATQKNGWICFVYNGTADFFAFFFVLTGLLKLLPLLKSDALLATPDLIYIVGGFVELAIGIWWVFDVRRKLRYYVTLTMLALLVAIGIKFSLDGLTSCGCYGLVQTPPIVSLSIASILFAWLIVFRHRFDGTRKPWHDRLTLGGIAGILVGIGLVHLKTRRIERRFRL